METTIRVTFRPGYGSKPGGETKTYGPIKRYEFGEEFTDTFKLQLFYESGKKLIVWIPRASLQELKVCEEPSEE